MRERPILFSSPMVRALLTGTKTQTRRVAKGVVAVHEQTGEPLAALDSAGPRVPCPYGQPGDRLWVRESWSPDPPCDGTWGYTSWAGSKLGQIAGVPERFRHPRYCNYAANWLHGDILWTPSIHMPRWACRILLEITEVRVERLQDISEADALAEGPAGHPDGPWHAFRSLWTLINGAESWAANPWVWAVSFKAVPSPAEEGR